MIVRNSRLLASDPASAPQGGQSGDGQATDPTVGLANLLAQQNSQSTADANDSATESTEVSPEEPAEQAQQEEPGEEISKPEEESQAAAEATESETQDDPEGESAREDARPTGAVQKRIDQLTAQKKSALEEVEKLRAEVEELRSNGAQGTASLTTAQFPEAIAKLKSVGEVQARLDVVNGDLDALTDFLDANPGSAEDKYQIGGKEFTRSELVQRKAALRAESRQLPQRMQQITAQAQLQQQRNHSAQALLKEFPALKDAENPTTQTFAKLRKLPQFEREANGDELAYYMTRGYELVQAERSLRTANAAKAAKPLSSLQGKVPAKKPHTAASAATRPAAGNAAAAAEAHKKDGSRDSFANLLSATGGAFARKS